MAEKKTTITITIDSFDALRDPSDVARVRGVRQPVPKMRVLRRVPSDDEISAAGLNMVRMMDYMNLKRG